MVFVYVVYVFIKLEHKITRAAIFDNVVVCGNQLMVEALSSQTRSAQTLLYQSEMT